MGLNISQNADIIAPLNNWARQLDSTVQGMSRRIDLVSETAATAATTAAAATIAPAGAVSSVSASESGVTINGIIHSLITAQYTSPSPIGTFAGVFLVATGYHGSATPVKIAEDNFSNGPGIAQSFAVPLDRTNETITLYFVSKNSQEVALQANWTSAPSTTVVLDGNASAPVAPTSVVATPGWQVINLQWAPNAETNLNNYNIYRYTSNTPTSATIIGTVAGGVNAGVLSFLDTTCAVGTTYYYWITAVNTAAQEGAKSSAVSGAATQGVPLANADFEFGVGTNGSQIAIDSGWVVDSGAANLFTYATNPGGIGPYTGSRSAQVGGNPGTSSILKNIFTFPAKPGDTFLGAVAYQTSGAGVFAVIQVVWVDSSGATVSASAINSSTSSVGAWTYVKNVVVAPANTASAYFRVFYSSTSTNSGYCWFDACALSAVVPSQQVSAVSTGNAPQVNAILSQTAGSTIINIAASTYNFGFGTVSYNSGSVDPGAYGTYYVYADDVGYQGGAVTYHTATTNATLVAAEWRIFFGKITTVAGGSSGGGGGGGACPKSGAPVRLYGDPTWWSKTVVPQEDFIRIRTTTGREGYFSPTDLRYCRRGLLAVLLWRPGDLALTEDGEELVTEVAPVHLAGEHVDFYQATQGHVFSAWGFIGHNKPI